MSEQDSESSSGAEEQQTFVQRLWKRIFADETNRPKIVDRDDPKGNYVNEDEGEISRLDITDEGDPEGHRSE